MLLQGRQKQQAGSESAAAAAVEETGLEQQQLQVVVSESSALAAPAADVELPVVAVVESASAWRRGLLSFSARQTSELGLQEWLMPLYRV